MKTMKNRLIALLLVSTMFITLCGCGKTENSAIDTTKKIKEITEEAVATSSVPDVRNADPSNPYKSLGYDLSEHRDIKMYVVADEPAMMPEVMEIVNTKYMEPWLNTTLDIEFIPWGVVGTKYPLLLQGGEQVDLIYTASWMGYSGHAQNGAFLELN